MRPRFLIDENLMPDLKTAIWRHDMSIDVLRVGDGGAPSLETLDPEILAYLEISQRCLITNNRKSMPGHVDTHSVAGRHHWGIFRVRRGTTIGRLAATVHLIWAASEAEEWKDRMEWIPF